MNTSALLSARRLLVRTVLLVGGLCLLALPFALPPVTTVKPADKGAVPPKLAFEDAKVDPYAAAVGGMWNVAPVQKKKIAFEDVQIDPLAAERAGLWKIDVAAGNGVTRDVAARP